MGGGGGGGIDLFCVVSVVCVCVCVFDYLLLSYWASLHTKDRVIYKETLNKRSYFVQ